MDINHQFDQELLSAYLDDALTADELGLVEQWLAEDPAAVTYLNELRSNRNTLKAIASLPAIGLRSDFADRVVAQAIQAASTEKATDHDRQNHAVDLPKTIPTHSKQWWAWGSIAAVAAAVTWFAIVPMFDKPTMQPLVAQPSNGPAPNLPEPEDVVPKPIVQPGDAPTPGTYVREGVPSPEKLNSPDRLAPLQLIFIGDAVMSKTAWESGKFDQLLDEYGIRYEKELIASKEMIEGLVESQTIVGPEADPTSRQEAALVYIDCPAVALSKLLVKLENDGKDFVNFNVTMAMNGGGLGLPGSYDKLLSALQKETSPSTGRGIARLVVPDNSSPALGKLLTGFEVVEKTKKAGGAELASLVAAGAEMRGNKSAANESGQMLLILRKE